MNDLLARIYRKSRTHRWLYPIYLGLRLPLTFVQLARQEGVMGAARWLTIRARFLLANHRRYGQAGFFDQPITPFRSRHGFTLARPIEFIIYDEIFLERCYDFPGLEEIVRSGPPVFVDFGTHHGLVIDYLRTLRPDGHYYGAEMNPVALAAARERFGDDPRVHLHNVAIGGRPRQERFSLATVSTEQSLGSPGNEGDLQVEVVTPVEFLRRCQLQNSPVNVLKMDIEGAEQEVFENPESILPLLRHCRALIIEIHDTAQVAMISNVLAGVGLEPGGTHGINHFFRRKADETKP